MEINKFVNKETFNKLLPFILGGLLLVALKYGKSAISVIKQKFATAAAIKATNESYSKVVNISGSNVSVNLDTIASGIYFAFYNSKGKQRINEDESAAVESLVKCPKDQITSLAAVYAAKYGKVLKDDLISKLSKNDWNSVKYLFE